MTQLGPTSDFIWLLIVVLGAGTFALRISFIQLYTWMDEFPPEIEQALSFIPAAILAALIFPELFALDGSFVGVFLNPHAVAGGTAAVVAWRTASMMATIVVGMGVLWVIQFFVA